MLTKFRGMTFVICFSLMNAAVADTLSPDLQDLKKRWDGVKKEEGHDLYMALSKETYGKEVSLHDVLIFQKELGKLELKEDSKIKKITFSKLENNEVRKVIIKKLFASRDVTYEFCRAYPIVELKFTEGDSDVSDMERKKLQDRANLNSCRRLTESMLGGILYANPNVYLFEAKLSDADSWSQSVVVYVRSIIDSQQYLRYHFKLRT